MIYQSILFIIFLILSFRAQAADPALLSSKAALSSSSDAVIITLTGAGFADGATIHLAGQPLPTIKLPDGGLRASASSAKTVGGLAVIQVRNPDGSGTSLQVVEVEVPNARVSARAAGRFLEQASWGPSPDSILEVRQKGFEAWIDQQFALPISDYPEVPIEDTRQSLLPAQRRFFYNAIQEPDQLRQRMAFALHQIWVVSAAKTNQARMIIPYLRILNQHAFGNYRTLMEEMTLSPTMGRYLDMVNNVKPDRARGINANENYAREIMQLFTVGTVKLNPDGTRVLDSQGKPVPTYSQSTIENLALVFTGWTFPPTPGRTPAATNPAYYDGRMVPWEANHDTSAKVLLDDFRIPAGLTARQDLDTALKHLFEHPNVGPFVARRLIGALVTSNPSPAYVGRVAAQFNSDPNGLRGDLKAVAKAILLDPEARLGDEAETPAAYGHLREPVLYVTALLRALGATVAEAHGLAARAATMGQTLFTAPTVFNYFPLLYELPGSPGVLAPEFEILTPANALARANFADAVAFSRLGATVTMDLTPLMNLATVHPWYASEAVNRVLLHGRMSDPIREQILTAMAYSEDPVYQAQTAIYLAASALIYQVQN